MQEQQPPTRESRVSTTHFGVVVCVWLCVWTFPIYQHAFLHQESKFLESIPFRPWERLFTVQIGGQPKGMLEDRLQLAWDAGTWTRDITLFVRFAKNSALLVEALWRFSSDGELEAVQLLAHTPGTKSFLLGRNLKTAPIWSAMVGGESLVQDGLFSPPEGLALSLRQEWFGLEQAPCPFLLTSEDLPTFLGLPPFRLRLQGNPECSEGRSLELWSESMGTQKLSLEKSLLQGKSNNVVWSLTPAGRDVLEVQRRDLRSWKHSFRARPGLPDGLPSDGKRGLAQLLELFQRDPN